LDSSAVVSDLTASGHLIFIQYCLLLLATQLDIYTIVTFILIRAEMVVGFQNSEVLQIQSFGADLDLCEQGWGFEILPAYSGDQQSFLCCKKWCSSVITFIIETVKCLLVIHNVFVCCRLDHFSQLYAKKVGLSEKVLRKTLWGDFYVDTKAKSVKKGAQVKSIFRITYYGEILVHFPVIDYSAANI
jgi:hypothetical protein